MALNTWVPDKCPHSLLQALWPSVGSHYHVPSEEVPQTCNEGAHHVSHNSNIIFSQALRVSTGHTQGTGQQDPSFGPVFSVASATKELNRSVTLKHNVEEDIHQTVC